MVTTRFIPSGRQQTLVVLVLFLVNSIPPISPSAELVSREVQVKLQPESDSKPKCSSLGFPVYERWEKPVGLFPFYQEDCKLGYVDTLGRAVIPAKFDQ